jgi:hypothetical protein
MLQIVSGGQTGVDRGALDVAIALGIPHGGWCPQRRLAEDGPIPLRYQLRETNSPQYPVRTERNVLDSDATLILHAGRLAGGTELTRRLAIEHGKPCLVLDLDQPIDLKTVSQWIAEHRAHRLNVAGPRESQVPGIHDRTVEFLTRLLKEA